MLLLQPHILIHGSYNANSKKRKEKKNAEKKRRERENERKEIQQLTQHESRALA